MIDIDNKPAFTDTVCCLSYTLNIYYRWFVLQEWISNSNITSKVKPEMWDAMRSPFRAKHMSDNMFIEDLVRWHQWHHYNIILDNSDTMVLSGYLLDNRYYQRENVQIIDELSFIVHIIIHAP